MLVAILAFSWNVWTHCQGKGEDAERRKRADDLDGVRRQTNDDADRERRRRQDEEDTKRRERKEEKEDAKIEKAGQMTEKRETRAAKQPEDLIQEFWYVRVKCESPSHLTLHETWPIQRRLQAEREITTYCLTGGRCSKGKADAVKVDNYHKTQLELAHEIRDRASPERARTQRCVVE